MATNQADLVKALVDAGVHFGHRVSRWNPKMEPYIHGKRNMIHIIDVKETVKGLVRAKKLVSAVVREGTRPRAPVDGRHGRDRAERGVRRPGTRLPARDGRRLR